MQEEKFNNNFGEDSAKVDDFSIEEQEGEGEYQPANSSQSIFKDLGRGQKIALIFLAFFSVLIFVSWGMNLQNSIKSPFEIKSPLTGAGIEEAGGSGTTDEDLKVVDSDKDGLSDFDELNLFETSPYLDDTDGDGFSDKEEINSGNNPLCAEGDDCYGDSLKSADAIPDASIDVGQLTPIDQALTDESAPRELTEEEKTAIDSGFGDQVDAETLRALLVEAGLDVEILNQISDEDLLSSYQEIMQ